MNRSRPLAADSRSRPEVANASTTVIGMDFIPRHQFQPLEGPALPISAAKQQRLANLLARYQADEITPAQYHQERAKILAGP